MTVLVHQPGHDGLRLLADTADLFAVRSLGAHGSATAILPTTLKRGSKPGSEDLGRRNVSGQGTKYAVPSRETSCGHTSHFKLEIQSAPPPPPPHRLRPLP